MSKHHLENLAEKIANKGHGSEAKSEDIQTKVAEEDGSIKLRAYQIHLEKGGSDLDNWLEAERNVKSSDGAVARLINEGNPNT